MMIRSVRHVRSRFPSLVNRVLVFSLAVVAISCSEQNERERTLTTQAAVTNPDAAAVVQPRRHILADVASIIEADVVAMRFAYDDRGGPRTVIRIENTVVHAGLAGEGEEFSQQGGPMPDGRYLTVSELPRFSIGSRYILFLTRFPWVLTPVWAGFAFRIEQFPKKSIVVGPNGAPVLAFDASGVRFGATHVVPSAPYDLDNPFAPEPRSAEVTETDPDVVAALSPKEFVQAAISTAQNAGAMLGASVSYSPDPSLKWDTIPISPAPGFTPQDGAPKTAGGEP